VTAKRTGSTGRLKVDAAHAVPPDLKVEVLDRAKDDQTFGVLVSSPWLKKYRRPVEAEWKLPTKASDLVDSLMKEFTAKGVALRSRFLSLRGAGKQLWEQAAPDDFKEAFWLLDEEGRPAETILVVSEERNIPWELMIPLQKGSRDFRPLGVRASIARWFESTELRSPGTPLQDAKVVAGDHTPPPRPLRYAADESSWIRQRIGGSQISPATPTTIETAISKWDGTLLHFVCHGDNGTTQAVLLDGSEKLTSTQVDGMIELTDAWSESAPVVFLNACDVGRSAPALSGVGGLAKAWADAGAGAVVAPLWSVRDSIAHDVAVRFYQATQAVPSPPYARIVRDIRALAYGANAGEDTYAAYCYFGSPTAAAQM
jgi:CHAT domain